MQQYKNTLVLSLVAVSLSACVSSRGPAPVSERGGSVPSGSQPEAASQAPAVARPGYYIVKPGENLYRIALEHGQDYKEIAAWNGLENPNVIQAGQELRVMPPDNGVVTNPVTSASGVEVRPIGASSSVEARPISGTIDAAPAMAQQAPAVAAAAAETLRREPKGGKLPYSEQAWALARKPDAAASQVRTESRRDAKSDTPAEPKSDKSAQIAESSRSNTAEDGVEWGWPGAGKVMTGFNDSSSKGLDLTGKTGDPVVAAAAGKVVYAGTALRGYGRLLIIKHGSNYSSVYAHNSQLLVKEGQQVKRGQKIAELGDTDSDRPKLHFEIRRQGKPVDPAKYLPNR